MNTDKVSRSKTKVSPENNVDTPIYFSKNENNVVINPLACNGEKILSVNQDVNSIEEDNNYDNENIIKQSVKDENLGRKSNTRFLGISLALCGSILASVQGGIINYLTVIPSGEVAVTVGFYTSVFFIVVANFQGTSLFNFRKRKFMIARSLIGGCTLLTRTWSVQHLPYGDATAIIFTMPIFTAIMARIWLKEKLTLVHIFAMIVGITGIVLIAKPSFIFPAAVTKDIPDWYTVIPVLSSIAYSLLFVLQRRIGKSVDVIVVCFWQAFCQMTFAGIYHFASQSAVVNPICYKDRGLLFSCPILSLVMLVCVNKALTIEKSSTVSLIRNMDTVMAYIIQTVVFKISTDGLSLGGAAMIISGTIAIGLMKVFNIKCGFEI